MKQFRIEAANLHWMDDTVNDPDDLCLHGDAVAYIGDRKLEYQECTVSATALYLLKTLTEDHIINQDNQMLPCCEHFLMANDDQTEVTIVGCPNGIDWSVMHSGDSVRLILEDGYEVSVPITQYREEVCRFADYIEKYYLNCPPKMEPQDEFDKNGYQTFWREWRRRRKNAIINQ